MNLIQLKQQNFKGIRSFVVDANGNSIDIFGDNGTGKSTIFDSFLWLLFDKDSAGKEGEGRGGFRLKTLDDSGKAIPMIDHSVEATIDHYGKRITLKKTLTESWVKARGSETAEFSGHKTAYEVDGVPRQKKEFDAFIAKLCDESVLRMLTDPDYFAGKMDWRERRRILLEICGDISDADVIDNAVNIGNKDMLELLNVINTGRSLDDHRKVISARMSAINAELKAIPVRVDEATRALPDVSQINPEALQSDLSKARVKLQEIDQALLDLKNGDGKEKLQMMLQKKEIALIAERNQMETERGKILKAKSNDINNTFLQKGQIDADQIAVAAKTKIVTQSIANMEMDLASLRLAWMDEDSKEFIEPESQNCPTCGQALPPEEIVDARQRALAEFNAHKAKELERIRNDGIAMADRQKQAQAERDALLTQEKTNEKKIKELEKQIAALQTEMNTEANKPLQDTLDAQALQHEIKNIKDDLACLEKDAEPKRQKITEERAEWRQVVTTLEQEAAKLENRKAGEKRIVELKASEKKLAGEYEQLQHQTYLSEEFTRTKVGMLEERINSRFKYARFKMFEQQINGGLTDVCDVLGPDMVPYNGGLNNAAKINTGIDIINTLSAHFGFVAPIFIDNAEAVTKLIETPAQVIRLVVCEPDKALRVVA